MKAMKTAALIFTVGLFGAGATSVAHAQVFKCVDSAGKTVYSQSPCPKDSRATTLQRSAPAPAPAAKADGKGDAKGTGPKTAAELEQDFRKRRAEQEAEAKKADEKVAEARDKEENCKRARMSLASLEASGRQSRVEENGERRYLSDSEIDQEKDRARRSIQTLCN